MLAVVPIGVVLPYAGSTAPALFLLCDGAAISRTTYADLFNLIGTQYGTGDGSTTFNLPDIAGRVIAGHAASGGHTDVSTLGNNDGTAKANRRPKHYHKTIYGAGASVGGSFENWGGSFDNTSTTRDTSTTGGTQDAPSYIVLAHIIKVLQS